MKPDELKQWRQERGLTRQELGKLTGYSADTIQSYEQARRPIQARFLLALNSVRVAVKK